MKRRYGGLAQLGEHLLCKQGVKGSIPLISTRREPRHAYRIGYGEMEKKGPRSGKEQEANGSSRKQVQTLLGRKIWADSSAG